MLEDLGRTPDEVAESLRACHIRGVRNTVRILNPIVRYVVSRTPDARTVDLTRGDRLRIVFATGRVSEIAVPDAAMQFLERFHRGEYPDLEMPTGLG